MDRKHYLNQRNQQKTASMKRSPYLAPRLPPVNLARDRPAPEGKANDKIRTTLGYPRAYMKSFTKPSLTFSNEPIPGSSTGPAAENTGRPDLLQKMPSNPSPIIPKIPEGKANDRGMRSRSQSKVEERANTTMDETVARVNAAQQASSVASAVMDYITSASFKSDLEQHVKEEIRARIAEAVKVVDVHRHAMILGTADEKVQDISQDQQSSNQSVSQSSVQTEAPARSRQEARARQFGITTASLLASQLRETRDQMIEQLQSKSPEIPAASNSTQEMVGNVYESIVASLINGDSRNSAESTSTDSFASMIGANRSFDRACKYICQSIDSNDSQSPISESTDPDDEFKTMFVTTKVTTSIEMDGDHASLVPSPPPIKKPDRPEGPTRRSMRPITKDRALSNTAILKPLTSSKKSRLVEASVYRGSKEQERPPFFISTALSPPTRLTGRPLRASIKQKEQYTSRGPVGIQRRKPCDFPHHIGIGRLPPETTVDLKYLFQAAPGILPPLRKYHYVGEVGWNSERGLQLNSRTLLTNHQLKLTGFRLAMEDRISQMPPYLRHRYTAGTSSSRVPLGAKVSSGTNGKGSSLDLIEQESHSRINTGNTAE